MADFNYTVKSGDKGLTYIFLDKAKEAGYEGDSKKINWQNVLSVFDQIQEEEKAEGEKLYSGGNDKTRAGWGKSYAIKVGDIINLTKAQLDKIYTAMGFKKVESPAADAGAAEEVEEGKSAKGTEGAGAAEEVEGAADIPKPTQPPTDAENIPPKSEVPAKIPSNLIEGYSIPNANLVNQKIQMGDQTWQYDSNGRLDKIFDSRGRELRDIDYDDNGKVIAVYTAQYNENGDYTRAAKYNADGSVSWYKDYKYNEKGQNIRDIYYRADGSVDYYYDYEYDEKGQCTRGICYNADGSVNYYGDSEYNEKGQRTRGIRYNADGSVNYYGDYEYDENGNKISSKYYNPDGTERK